ncbi:MAG: hypothetical protein MJE77_28500 [Proteobacteria bacterium]|nr:hypothetical protein [Pseudomonadota bacterium]
MKRVGVMVLSTILAGYLVGCIELQQELDVDIGAKTQLIEGEQFKDWYCSPHHKFLCCGTEQSGRTVVKSRAKDIWVYATPTDGTIQIDVAEKINGEWVTVATETAEPGWVGRGFLFDTETFRRARIIKANNDIYHVSVHGD